MRTVIFGAKGQLGRELVAVFQTQGDTASHDLPEVDIVDRDAVYAAVRACAPDLVVNAAAYTDVEAAEADRAAAFRVNQDGARHVADAAAEQGAPVVYYSTDYVFGGTRTTPYQPDDPVAPIGVYARSKAAGEAATRVASTKHIIIRTAWLYGPGGNNFVEKILSAGAKRPTLKVVTDEVGSPTYTRDLAEATMALVEAGVFGTYHAVNKGACSRFEFAGTIVALGGLSTQVHPCTSADFPTKAERPLYSVLSTDTLEKATGHAMRSWQEALEAYMKRRSSHA